VSHATDSDELTDGDWYDEDDDDDWQEDPGDADDWKGDCAQDCYFGGTYEDYQRFMDDMDREGHDDTEA
jgi:hypothetical protein